MPRNFLKRFLPDRDRVRRQHLFHRLGARLDVPDVWHLNRRSAAGGVAVGLFVAFVPIPFQTLLAAALALLLRVNLPLAIAAVWVTNPLTIPAIAYVAYKVGTSILGVEAPPASVESTAFWLLQYTGRAWKSILLGSLLLGAAASLAGLALVRLVWRLHVVYRWGRRPRSVP